MNKFLAFLHFPISTKIILLKIFFLLPFSQLCITILPLTRLIKVFSLNPKLNNSSKKYTKENSDYVQLVSWAVSAMHRNVPFMNHSKCLAQALTARYFLKKNGPPCILLVGANIGDNGRMKAHAWLTQGNLTLNFGSNCNHFIEITKFY